MAEDGGKGALYGIQSDEMMAVVKRVIKMLCTGYGLGKRRLKMAIRVKGNDASKGRLGCFLETVKLDIDG